MTQLLSSNLKDTISPKELPYVAYTRLCDILIKIVTMVTELPQQLHAVCEGHSKQFLL